MKEPKIPKEVEELSEEISGGYWNTRVIRKFVENESYMGVYEVYYKADDTIWAWSEDPISVTFNDIEEFGEVLGQIIKAAEKPVLELKNDELIETTEIVLDKKDKQNASE